MELNLLVGPPGSGKSTFSRGLSTTYINQDSQGREGHFQLFLEALKHKKDITVDRMNFNVQQRERYITAAKAAGYKTTATIFYTPRSICFDRCVARVDHETIKDEKAANSALNLFFGKYEAPTVGEVDEVTSVEYGVGSSVCMKTKEPAILCDLDGTLCNIEHRKHLVQKAIDSTKLGKPNWPAFFRAMERDEVNEWCAAILNRFKDSHQIIYCSGRPEEYRATTETWLKKNDLWFGKLFMRSSGDYRQDNIVKEILLDFNILPQYIPLFVLDDRLQVVQMWRRRNIVCLQCDEGNF